MGRFNSAMRSGSTSKCTGTTTLSLLLSYSSPTLLTSPILMPRSVTAAPGDNPATDTLKYARKWTRRGNAAESAASSLA